MDGVNLNCMIRSFDVLLPRDFPYALVNFRFYFQNYGTGTVNLYHAAGMELIYEQERICFVLPGVVFFQLLRLQNIDQPHERKYELLLMKGWYDSVKAKMNIDISNRDLLESSWPGYDLDLHRQDMQRLPQSGDELAVADRRYSQIHHHFRCQDVSVVGREGDGPLVRLEYLESSSLLMIINGWLPEGEQLLFT